MSAQAEYRVGGHYRDGKLVAWVVQQRHDDLRSQGDDRPIWLGYQGGYAPTAAGKREAQADAAYLNGGS